MPKDALVISGTNKIVNEYNSRKLSQVPGELYEFRAKVSIATRKDFIPQLDNAGLIKNSPLPYICQLKVGARVMLSYNIDVVDSLTNGALGEVIGFKKVPNGEVRYVMVKFDDNDCGKDRRKALNFDKEFPNLNATAIDLLEFEFSMRAGGAAKAVAINFPLRLAWGTTAHKIQGHTVKKPQELILDLKCWLEPAMIYVMLSRVQCLSQLFILETLPVEKIKPWQDAVEEMERLDKLDLSKRIQCVASEIEIVSLNTVSLRTHIEDIRCDRGVMCAKVILLQETSISENQQPGLEFGLESKECHFNSKGHRKGLATYFTPEFEVLCDITNDKFQITSISSDKLTITNIYRSNGAGEEFLNALTDIIENSKVSHVILGDWNFCQRDESNHPVKVFLEENNFKAAIQPPQSTQREGRCLDQIYTRLDSSDVEFKSACVKTCYYSDHEPISITLKFNEL